MRAKKILTEHKTVVHNLVITLLQKPTLQDEEIQHIIATSRRSNYELYLFSLKSWFLQQSSWFFRWSVGLTVSWFSLDASERDNKNMK